MAIFNTDSLTIEMSAVLGLFLLLYCFKACSQQVRYDDFFVTKAMHPIQFGCMSL